MALVGAHLVYTPTSEAIRGGGIGPIANASDLGIVTALGTDGPMVDYSDDMFEQIKACVLFQHQRHLDPTRISIERAVEMATLDGALAAGLADDIGSLDVGKLADIAIFDMRRPHVGKRFGRESRDGRRQDRLPRRAIHERSEPWRGSQ
jgi:5-methylthioadenosine/S-adenosylhomocysteine deaminase